MSPRHPPHRGAPLGLDRERLSDALAALLPDARDRAFITRCLLDEGPDHHRGASYALILLAAHARSLIDVDAVAPSPGTPVPMRVSPTRGAGETPVYPLAVPDSAVARIAADDAHLAGALAACLVDGPPHHALANAALVTLLEALIRALEARR